MEMNVYEGRPADKRGENEEACYDLLDRLDVRYRRLDHAPAGTMELCQALEAALGAGVCKNLFLCNRQKTDFYLLLMPGDKPFKTRDVTGQLGCSRLSFAPGERMEEMIGARPGSASVLGLQFDREKRVQLVIDRDVLAAEQFGCHPCRNTSTLGFSTADLREKVLPALGHEAAYVTL